MRKETNQTPLGLFRKALPIEKTYHVLDIKAGEGYAVTLDHVRDNWRHVELHYNDKIERRVPCTGEDCECRRKAWAFEPRTYLAAMVCKMNVVAGKYVLPAMPFWTLNVVGITRNAMGVLADVDPGNLFCLWRRGGKKNGPICWQQLPVVDEPFVQVPYVCIEATLKGMWGIRS